MPHPKYKPTCHLSDMLPFYSTRVTRPSLTGCPRHGPSHSSSFKTSPPPLPGPHLKSQESWGSGESLCLSHQLGSVTVGLGILSELEIASIQQEGILNPSSTYPPNMVAITSVLLGQWSLPREVPGGPKDTQTWEERGFWADPGQGRRDSCGRGGDGPEALYFILLLFTRPHRGSNHHPNTATAQTQGSGRVPGRGWVSDLPCGGRSNRTCPS